MISVCTDAHAARRHRDTTSGLSADIMAMQLCCFIVDGRECGREMREEPGLIGLRGFLCPLGHWSYESLLELRLDSEERSKLRRGIFQGIARNDLSISLPLASFPVKLRFALNV
jgi:hypothetical protein